MEVAEVVDRKPWDRQPSEPQRAWQLFTMFRDLGPQRTMRGVAARAGVEVKTVTRAARVWSWAKRANLYDVVQDQALQKTSTEELAEIRKRQIQIGHLFTTTGALVVKKLYDKEKNSDTTEMTARDAAALVDIGVKLLRLNTDQPTERTETTFVGTLVPAQMTEAMRDATYRARLKDAVDALDALESRPRDDGESPDEGEVEQGEAPSEDQ